METIYIHALLPSSSKICYERRLICICSFFSTSLPSSHFTALSLLLLLLLVPLQRCICLLEYSVVSECYLFIHALTAALDGLACLHHHNLDEEIERELKTNKKCSCGSLFIIIIYHFALFPPPNYYTHTNRMANSD